MSREELPGRVKMTPLFAQGTITRDDNASCESLPSRGKLRALGKTCSLRGGWRRRRSAVGRLEAAGFVRAVAERLAGRLPAAAQRDRRLARVDMKLIPFGVNDRHRAFDDERTSDRVNEFERRPYFSPHCFVCG